MHERAHDNGEAESRGDLRISRGLRLRSLKLGLVGQADVVEFQKTDNTTAGVKLDGAPGLWQPFIIEYKHGKPKIGHEDEVQLCAQAICLEEMLGVTLAKASFFYGQPRRRQDMTLNQDIREETETLTAQLHKMFVTGVTPDPVYSSRCHSCSLENVCLPRVTRTHTGVKSYIHQQTQMLEGDR